MALQDRRAPRRDAAGQRLPRRQLPVLRRRRASTCPTQAEVDAFLGEKNVNWHAALDPQRPMAVDPLTGGAGGPGPRTFVALPQGPVRGMQNALRVITEVHEEWARRFGRTHAPLVESYRMDGAEYRAGDDRRMTGAAKDAVDEARDARRARRASSRSRPIGPFPVAGARSRRSPASKARGRGRPLGVVRLELRAGVPGRAGALQPRRRPHAGDELHRRARRRRSHAAAFRARDRARGAAARATRRAGPRPCGSTRRTERRDTATPTT